MTKLNRSQSLGIVLVVIAVIFSFFIIYNNLKEGESEVIRIGGVIPLTGPGAGIGESLRQGLEWKIEELRNEGYDIEFIMEDSQSDPKQAATAFKSLVEVRDVDIVFTILSSISLTLKPMAEQSEVLLWSDATHPDITKDTNYVLRHSDPAENDAKIMADYIKEKDYKKVGILYQLDDWGSISNEKLVFFLEKENMEVFSDSIDHKASDFRTQITKMKANDPDAIVFIAFGPAAGLLVKQTKELEYDGGLYSSLGLILTPDAITIAENYLEDTYYQTYVDKPGFVLDYTKKFNEPPSALGFVGYTDIELLVYAIEQTGSSEPEDIIEFIKNLKEFQGKYEHVEITPQGDIVVETMVKEWGS